MVAAIGRSPGGSLPMSDASAPPTGGPGAPVPGRFKSFNQSDGKCLIFDEEADARWIKSNVHRRVGRMR
jgi:hypothetical protein